jgi:thymidylate kinase
LFTIAIVGPDGSGKSFVSKKLIDTLPELKLKRVYMGINLEASNLMLPQTRLLLAVKRAQGGRPDMAGPYTKSHEKPAPKGLKKRFLSDVKGWLLMINRVSEEWFRQLVTWYYMRRGYNILFDRHFILDYYYHDMNYQDPQKPLPRRIHGYLLKKFYPRPDMVIYLDAPAEVLFQRKGEGTVELLEQYRQDFLSMAKIMPAFAIVDASQPVDAVIAQAAEIIRAYASNRSTPKQPAPVDQEPSGQWR